MSTIMKRGKRICETLKAIRSEIASANEIDYQPTECTHEGDCAGTCPKCESETRWLERQLRARQALGKAVTIAGLSVALGAMSSCHPKIFQPDGMVMRPVEPDTPTNLVNKVENDSINTSVLTVADNDSTEKIDMQLMGDVVKTAPETPDPNQCNTKKTTKESSTKKKSSKKK